MSLFGMIGTLVGLIASAFAAIISGFIYLKFSKKKTIWTDFLAMVFSISSVIFVLSLLGFIKVIMSIQTVWFDYLELSIYILLAIIVYYFYATTIKMFEDLLGVKV